MEGVEHFYATIGSKPWWIWGFEHGINECGVAIGNEAEWSWIPAVEENLLLGMDLLRLGLERGATAREAMEVIASLLEKYGQGGACKYGGSIKDTAYHNSFLISDPNEVWLFETVDRYWIAKRIDTQVTISNVYTIEEDYDLVSDGLIELAIEQGLHVEGEPFNFTKSFQLLDGTPLTGHVRHERSTMMLNAIDRPVGWQDILSILRDHNDGQYVQNRWSPVSGFNANICCHGSTKTSQTAATMVVEYHETPYKELLFTYWGSMCPPCCSFVVPFFNTGYIPACLGTEADTHKYSPDSFWWKVERMVIGIEQNYERYHSYIDEVRPAMEAEFKAAADEALAKAGELAASGKHDAARELLNALTDSCLERVEAEVARITEAIEADLAERPAQVYRAHHIDYFKKLANMP